MESPLISVVIPVRNESNRLISTIHSIAHNRSTDFDLEIVVVDDASTDGCCSNLSYDANHLTIKIHRLPQRVGVPHARNYGAYYARGETLFITDSHVNFCTNWDLHILDNIQENRVLAATITDATSMFKGYGCKLIVPFMGTRWNRVFSDEDLQPVHVASSAGTILKNKLFKKIGGYDSGMILYGGAEPEFSIRCWLSGAEIVSVPKLTVQHRFKMQEEKNSLLEPLRAFMIHNNLRFGLLYLSDLAIFQMIRYYALNFPDKIQDALRLLKESDVWERRSFLENNLKYNFYWFVNKFKLTDHIGQKIL